MNTFEDTASPRSASATVRTTRAFPSRSLLALAAFTIASGMSLLSSEARAQTNTNALNPVMVGPVKPISTPVSLPDMGQIQALMADKLTWTAAEQKMDCHFIYAARTLRGQTAVAGITNLPNDVVVDAKKRVAVDIQGTVTSALLSGITAVGGEIQLSYPEGNSVTANVPLLQLAALAARSDVRFIARQYGNKHNTFPAPPPVKKNQRPLVPYRFTDQHRAALRQRVKAALASSILRGTVGSTLEALLLQTGSVTSEGDTTHQASLARSTYGINGTGIKIGVLSDSVWHLSNAVSTGDLPSNVTVVSGQAGSTTSGGEGTAMLEIVYDLVPGAQLFFASADNGETSFANNIKTLRNTYGCDIIVDDVYYFDEPPFQDGVVAQAVNTVTASGALYYSSAGNQGHMDPTGNNINLVAYDPADFPTQVTASVWEGDFSNDGTTMVTATSGAKTISGYVHQYKSGASTVNYNTTTEDANSSAWLFWSDPFNAATDDYDMYVLAPTGSTVVGFSQNIQSAASPGTAYEDAAITATGDRVFIVRNASAAVRALDLNLFGDGYGASMAFYTSGQTHGHSSAANAFSVAAAPATNDTRFYPIPAGGPYPNPFTTSSKEELFTSDGPRRIFYNVDLSGNVTPVTTGNYLFATSGGTVRQKPDITAADGVTTSQSGVTKNGTTTGDFNPFYGTSAAAPHAAAIAGLIKSYSASSNGTTINGKLINSADMHTIMQSTALDIANSGVDNNTGYGIIMPIPEIQFLQNFLYNQTVFAVPADTSATITWNTLLPANTIINYGITNSLGTPYTNSTATTSHNATLTGLSAGTTYYYAITTATASGSVTYTDPTVRTFTTVAATPPSLALSSISLATAGGTTTATVTIINNGGASSVVTLTSATLAGKATTTTIPMGLGSLAAGATTTVNLTFPAVASGRTVLSLQLTDGTGAVDNFSSRVTAP